MCRSPFDFDCTWHRIASFCHCVRHLPFWPPYHVWRSFSFHLNSEKAGVVGMREFTNWRETGTITILMSKYTHSHIYVHVHARHKDAFSLCFSLRRTPSRYVSLFLSYLLTHRRADTLLLTLSYMYIHAHSSSVAHLSFLYICKLLSLCLSIQQLLILVSFSLPLSFSNSLPLVPNQAWHTTHAMPNWACRTARLHRDRWWPR